MKKVLSVVIAVVMLIGILPVVSGAVTTLTAPVVFTWAWGANKIEVDNSLTVVSWSGGSNSSYRSGFIVYDLPEDFSYTSVKTQVVASFAINKATLNNGTAQAPTAAIVMVDGDKVKQAYSLKSGANATALLNEAKQKGVVMGTYKIGQYPRTSRLKNYVINDFFEKNPSVKSIGFYVTNIASDGYTGTVNGIASAMTDFEVNFDYYQNYANTTVKMVDDKGNVLQTMDVRNQVGTVINVPDKIESDSVIWVRDNSDAITLVDDMEEVLVTYHDDKGDREKYVETIKNQIAALLSNPVKNDIDLPHKYITEDGYEIRIEWFTTDETVVDNSGKVYQGTEAQSAQLYAKIWIGEYTSVETDKYNVTVLPIEQSETDNALVLNIGFDEEDHSRGNFENDTTIVTPLIEDSFTVASYIRIDDFTKGGTIFNVQGVECGINTDGTIKVGDNESTIKLNEAQWYHIAVTNSAVYVDGEKICDVALHIDSEQSFIGGYTGKMDNFKVYCTVLSQSVIKSLMEEGYDSPNVEVVSASVIEGMDGSVVKISSNGYEDFATVYAYAEKDGIRHSGMKVGTIEKGLNVFSVNIPNMGGMATENNVKVLVWDENMKPVTNTHNADRTFGFSYDYTHPDNHMLSNTFTLMGKNTGLYLTSSGLSQRAESGYWSAPYMVGTNTDGYYSLKNKNGSRISGNWTFEQVEDNVYKIKNHDTGEYLSYGVEDEWILNIAEYDTVSKAFASEGFMLLSANQREYIYNVTGQAMWQSGARRDKLIELVSNDYYTLDGHAQAEKLGELLTYYPSYQINRPINKSTTGVEAEYTLSSITWTNYEDMDSNTKSGYTATATYSYNEGDVEVAIFARSQNVVRNIAKGFSYMPYQFIKPLKTVIDYNASNNQFKAETGLIYIETNYEVSWENVAITGAHELGHLIDFAGYRMSMGDYRSAREKECSVSGYGDTALSEDFAEFCQAVISCSGDEELLRQLKIMFPGRYDAVCKGMCEMYGECILK